MSVVYAGSINVSTTADDNGAGCTLREAIEYADSGGTLVNDCTGWTLGANTINVPGGTYTLSTTHLEVDSEITIQPLTTDGVVIQSAETENTAGYRVLRVNSTGNLTLKSLTLRYGGNSSFGMSGGCIYADQSILTLTGGTVIEDCYTGTSGGGVSMNGAVFSMNGGSVIQNNHAVSNGGGVYATNGTITMNSAEFYNNQLVNVGSSAGGAIHISSAQGSSISNSLFDGNSAAGSSSSTGGAIHQVGSGLVTVTGSVFTGNRAINSSVDFGGAIFTTRGVTVSDSRFESNTADEGSAVYHRGANNDTIITFSCFTNNSDMAVFDLNNDSNGIDATGGGDVGNSNWWGTSWGPRIIAAGGGSAVSNGDSINGNGNTVNGNILVDVNLSNPGDILTSPSGSWITTAPIVAGAICQTCSSVSGGGSPRACY